MFFHGHVVLVVFWLELVQIGNKLAISRFSLQSSIFFAPKPDTLVFRLN